MFTGTTQQQDTRFSDKEKKLMKQMKFGDCLNKRVDMSKVKLDVLRPWISKKITGILHIEDDVVVEFVYNQLEEEKYPCPKKMQINMTGFLNGRNARQFMGELWALLLSAQDSESGIPAEFIHNKKDEILKRKTHSSLSSPPPRFEREQSREHDKRYDRDTEDRHGVQDRERERDRSKLKIDFKTGSIEASTLRRVTDDADEIPSVGLISSTASETNERSSKAKTTLEDTSVSDKQAKGSVSERFENHEKHVKQRSQSPRNQSKTYEDSHHSHKSQRTDSNRRGSVGSKADNNQMSANGHEKNKEKEKISQDNSNKKRKHDRSANSDDSDVSQSSLKVKKLETENQDDNRRSSKLSYNSSNLSRSDRDRDRDRDRERSRSPSRDKSGMSHASNTDKKGFEMNKTNKSAQAKRHYRNNRCNSTSSNERETKTDHHRESERSEKNTQRWSFNRKNVKAKYDRRSASPRSYLRGSSRSPRHHSRSPRRSRSPRWTNRRKSPPPSYRRGRGNSRERTSSNWRRSVSKGRSRYDRPSKKESSPDYSRSRRSRERSTGRNSSQNPNDIPRRRPYTSTSHQSKNNNNNTSSSSHTIERNSQDTRRVSSSPSDHHNNYSKQIVENNKLEDENDQKKGSNKSTARKESDRSSSKIYEKKVVSEKTLSPSRVSPHKNVKRIESNPVLDETENYRSKDDSLTSSSAEKKHRNEAETSSKKEEENGHENASKNVAEPLEMKISKKRSRASASLSRTPSPFLKLHERSESNIPLLSESLHKQLSSDGNEKSESNATLQTIRSSSGGTISKKSIIEKAIIIKNEGKNLSVSEIEESSAKKQSSTILATNKIVQEQDIIKLNPSRKSKKMQNDNSDNDSSSDTDAGSQSKKKKHKKGKKHSKKSKKSKKHKKKSSRARRSTSSESEEKVKRCPSSKSVKTSEPTMLFGDVNDDLEKKLRERALMSMKRMD